MTSTNAAAVLIDCGRSTIKCGLLQTVPSIGSVGSGSLHPATTSIASLPNLPHQLRTKTIPPALPPSLWSEHLGVDPNDRTVFLLDDLFTDKSSLIRQLFTEFNVQRVTVLPTHYAAMFCADTATVGDSALVIDCGESHCLPLAIIDGWPMFSALQVSGACGSPFVPFGGSDCTRLFTYLALHHGRVRSSNIDSVPLADYVKYGAPADWPIWDDLRHRLAFCFPATIANHTLPDVEISLPPNLGGGVLSIPGWVRGACTELFWGGGGMDRDGNKPWWFPSSSSTTTTDAHISLISTQLDRLEEDMSLPRCLLELLANCPRDRRKLLASRLYLIGGMADCPGFSRRLINEMQRLINEDLDGGRFSNLRGLVNDLKCVKTSLTVSQAGHRLSSTLCGWLGASLMLSLPASNTAGGALVTSSSTIGSSRLSLSLASLGLRSSTQQSNSIQQQLPSGWTISREEFMQSTKALPDCLWPGDNDTINKPSSSIKKRSFRKHWHYALDDGQWHQQSNNELR